MYKDNSKREKDMKRCLKTISKERKMSKDNFKKIEKDV